jgi:hypothetical protein
MSGKRKGNIPGTWATTLIEIQSAGRPEPTIPRQFPYSLNLAYNSCTLSGPIRNSGDVFLG